MIDKDYWEIRILISTKVRDKLKIGLKTYDILKDTWNLASLNTKISISIKKDFIDFMVKIMLDNEYRVNVESLLCDETYLFIYDVKTTELGQFPDFESFILTISRFASVLI